MFNVTSSLYYTVSHMCIYLYGSAAFQKQLVKLGGIVQSLKAASYFYCHYDGLSALCLSCVRWNNMELH